MPRFFGCKADHVVFYGNVQVCGTETGIFSGKILIHLLDDACIAAGGLKGNRANPKQTKGFYVLKNTKAPAVLVEYGFMDSATDAPVILTEAYAQQVAYGTMAGIAKVAGLTKKAPAAPYTREQFVRDVQGAIGAKVDGKPGSETISKTVTVSAEKNRTHPVVVFLQKRLASLGYTQVGEADGRAGPKFTAAVKAFQRDHGKNVDGEITAKNITWRKLLTL